MGKVEAGSGGKWQRKMSAEGLKADARRNVGGAGLIPSVAVPFLEAEG